VNSTSRRRYVQVRLIQGIRTGAGCNALDQPAFLNLGNGLTTRYGYYDPAYDPDRASFRLRSIQTTGPGGNLQDLSYAYRCNSLSRGGHLSAEGLVNRRAETTAHSEAGGGGWVKRHTLTGGCVAKKGYGQGRAGA
jgi:hypothetical protein